MKFTQEELAEMSAADAEIEAEFAGTVKRILVAPGQVIGTGEPLIEFE